MESQKVKFTLFLIKLYIYNIEIIYIGRKNGNPPPKILLGSLELIFSVKSLFKVGLE